MEELSIEEKAKAYDEAIVYAKKLLKTIGNATLGNLVLKNEFERIFPELKESEDERIRKELLNAFIESTDSLYIVLTPLKREAFIAWLEKQGEQKPTIEMKTPEESLGIDSETYNKIIDECIYGEQKSVWTPMDEQCVENLLAIIEGHGYPGEVAWLNSLKDRVQPKQEWSEEDESLKRRCIGAIDMANLSDYTKDNLLNWLKSLRPQNRWKPSLSQLNALGIVAKGNAPDDIEEIKSLYNDLHKLIN